MIFPAQRLRINKVQFSSVDLMLLGRDPFFEEFHVCFDERARTFSLTPYA